MADTDRLDVLRFVDLAVERKSAWGPGEYASRQIEINGQLLSDYLTARTGSAIEQSTPIVEEHVGIITPAAYLRALLGGPKDDPLDEGRVAIGYCDACLDGTCGKLLAVTLGVEGDTVSWTGVGWELFDDGQAPKLTPFWKKSGGESAGEASARWSAAPFAPDVSLRFSRDQYLVAFQSERMRLATGL
ncbi:MAG: hypothetical protein QOH69_1723 [Actinomycetota bacterium]|jgi:hypothetical protein|nr:hypothetical protein [Actinomycetota bacterium]MDQ1550806.1 hypothetical protein [Actinomycetota bacterium]